jgi:hypothetical protein
MAILEKALILVVGGGSVFVYKLSIGASLYINTIIE